MLIVGQSHGRDRPVAQSLALVTCQSTYVGHSWLGPHYCVSHLRMVEKLMHIAHIIAAAVSYGRSRTAATKGPNNVITCLGKALRRINLCWTVNSTNMYSGSTNHVAPRFSTTATTKFNCDQGHVFRASSLALVANFRGDSKHNSYADPNRSHYLKLSSTP